MITVVVTAFTVIIIIRGFAVPDHMRGANFIGLIALVTSLYTFVLAFLIGIAFLMFLPKIQDALSNSLTIQVAPLTISFLVCLYAQSKSSYFVLTTAQGKIINRNSNHNHNHNMMFELNNTAQTFFYVSTILIIGLAIARGEAGIITTISSWLMLFIIPEFKS